MRLPQRPHIEISVPSLIGFWHAGLASYHAEMIGAVECGKGQGKFLEVARSQVPLVELVINEFDKFSREGWDAIPGLAGGKLSAIDRERLSLFMDNELNAERIFAPLVKAVQGNNALLQDWYRSALHVFQLQPPLGPLIRKICRELLPQSIEQRVRIKHALDYNRYLRNECFVSARIAFTELLTNGIKFNRPGGKVTISHQGSKILFSDTGIGMDPHLAVALVEGTGSCIPGKGWPTIRKIASELGWWITADSAVDDGTVIEIDMNEANFHEPNPEDLTARELLEGGMFTFSNWRPFHGYSFMTAGMLDVSQSPIYMATVRANALLERLSEA